MSGDFEAGRLLLALDPDKYKQFGAGYSATEEEVERVIMRAYGSNNINGKDIGLNRAIGKMDERMLQNLVDYGPSALKNTDLYSRSNIYKVFQDKGAFDFSLDKQMGELVDKYKSALEPKLYSEIKDALLLKDEALRKTTLNTLINNNQNNQGLDALLTHSIFRKMERAAVEEGNILGVYVNRTMVVGSTLNQFDDYINLIANNSAMTDELKKLLGKQIGLVSSETAIDTSVNYSSSRFMAKMKNLSELANDVLLAGGSEDAASKAALQVIGYTDEQILKEGLDIDIVGRKAIKTLGERMGAATAVMTSQEFGSIFDSSLRPVIDQILLEDRLSLSDINDLLDSIRKGVADARKAQKLTGAQLDQLEEELRNISPTEAERRSALTRLFGASADHKYASMAKLNKIGENTRAQFDLIRRLNLSGIPEDHILAATNISEEARKIANVLLDKHSEAYQDVTAKLLDESAQYEKLMADIGKQRLGQQVYEDIIGAQQITGLSREEIINAFDKVAAERNALSRQRGMDLSRLYYLDDENFAGQITMARTKRMASAIRIKAGDLEEQKLNDLLSKKISSAGQLTQQEIQKNIYDYFQDMLSSAAAGSEEAYLAQAGIGQDIIGATEEEAEIARRRARAIRVKATNEALQQDQASAQALSATGKKTFTGDDNLRNAINAALNDEDYSNFLGAKGKFVRFSEYLKSGELKNLFKKDNLFRNSIYAAGALIVGSFAYQHFKDHTPEKVQGPPMLPGGSAYESQYPNRVSEIPQIGTTSYNPGVSYKVNLYGNRRQVSQFQDMAMGLGNFDMDTTMYSGIPQVGTDPYQQLASSY